jgi:RNA polymerase sigma factor (sigma-70 family)
MSIYDSYIKDLRKLKRVELTLEQEKEIIRKAQQGCQSSKTILVNNTLLLALKLVKKYINRGVEDMELISAANIGILEAIDSFDLNHEVRFITYAQYRINAKLTKCFINYYNVVNIEYNEEERILTKDLDSDYIYILKQAVNRLDTKERDIIDLYFGLTSGFPIHVLSRIEEKLNLSGPTVEKYYYSALNKLKEWVKLKE